MELPKPILVQMKQIRFTECPFSIIDASHYRKDKGCLCSNARYRQMMIDEWEYTEEDFKDIPLED